MSSAFTLKNNGNVAQWNEKTRSVWTVPYILFFLILGFDLTVLFFLFFFPLQVEDEDDLDSKDQFDDDDEEEEEEECDE